MYRQLDPELIVETAEQLSRRVGERFPDSGLSPGQPGATRRRAPGEGTLAAGCAAVGALRIALGIAVSGIIAVAVTTASWIAWHNAPNEWSEFAQGLDAALNLFVLVGAAVFSVITLETRVKRRRH